MSLRRDGASMPSWLPGVGIVVVLSFLVFAFVFAAVDLWFYLVAGLTLPLIAYLLYRVVLVAERIARAIEE